MHRINLLFLVILMQNLRSTQQNQDKTQGNHAIKRTDGGVSYANFEIHKFHYLQVSPPAFSHEVLQAQECAFACVTQQTCYSFNIGLSPNQNGKFLCELLSGDKFRSPTNLTSSQQFDHYSIEVNNLSYKGVTHVCIMKFNFSLVLKMSFLVRFLILLHKAKRTKYDLNYFFTWAHCVFTQGGQVSVSYLNIFMKKLILHWQDDRFLNM